MLTDRGLYIKLIIMSLPLPPPQSLFSIFFSSLVSSVRNPITVIKSADPQRALLQTAGEGGMEAWRGRDMVGRKEMDGRRLQREMMERRRDEAVDESVEEEAEQTL